MELMKLLEILRRRSKTFLIVFCAFFGTVLLVTLLAKPVYKSSVKILVESASDPQTALLGVLGLKTGSGLNTSPTSTGSSSYTFDTDIELVKITPLLDRLIAELKLKDRSGSPMKADRLTATGFLRKTILPQPYVSVDQHEDANMIRLDAYSPKPEEAMNMGNRLAQFYVDSKNERTRKEFQAARRLVESQLQGVTASFRDKVDAATKYRIKHETVNTETEASAYISKVMNAMTSYEENEKDIVNYTAKVALDREKIGKVSMYRKESEDQIYNDLTKYLRTKLGDIELSIASKSIDVTGEHPELRSFEKQVERAREVMKSESLKIFGGERHGVDPVYDDLSKKLVSDAIDREVSVAKRPILKSFIDENRKKLLELPVKSAGLSPLDSDVSVYKDTYAKITGLISALGVAEAIALTNLNILDSAVLPEEVYFPKKLLNIVIGLALGLFLGAFAAFLHDYTDDRIWTPDDMRTATAMPLIGAVPNLKDASFDNAFKTVRNAIGVEERAKEVRSLAIASVIPGEGKSTVAANLAGAFGGLGRRVAFVDMSFSNPLAGSLQGVDVVPVGSGIREARDKSSGAREFLDSLKREYDMVIVDTPAITRDPDSIGLCGAADGVLVVVESGKVRRPVFGYVDGLMRKSGLNAIGVLLNRFSL